MSPNLVENWIEYHTTKDADLFWSFEQLNELVHDDPEQAWKAIVAISSSSNDPAVLANLAAGPLEDLLHLHGPLFIDRFEIYTRQHPEFVYVAKGVWGSGSESSVWPRVHALQSKYS